MPTKPHLDWISPYRYDSIKYRSVYEQGKHDVIEVGLNAYNELFVGVFSFDTQKYYHYRGKRLLEDSAAHFGSPNPMLLRIRTHEQLRDALLPDLPSYLQQKVDAKMSAIAENVTQFLKAYTMHQHVIHPFELFAEYQLYRLHYSQTPSVNTKEYKLYVAKSDAGLPHLVHFKDGQPTFFRSAFGTERYLFETIPTANTTECSIAFYPSILKPLPVLVFHPNRHSFTRVSFVKVNDLNPCLLWETIPQPGLQRAYGHFYLAPFPMIPFMHYLRGEIKILHRPDWPEEILARR